MRLHAIVCLLAVAQASRVAQTQPPAADGSMGSAKFRVMPMITPTFAANPYAYFDRTWVPSIFNNYLSGAAAEIFFTKIFIS